MSRHRPPKPQREPRPSPRQERSRRAPDAAAPGSRGAHLVYGFHAVRAALEARRRPFLALHATEAAAERLADVIAAVRLRPHLVTGEDLSRRLG
ncbi:MAG: 23S rRNA (guanosine(2251)-2'-O)-methyltransferase RlmB, partial [Beijerinckiaceae bacterium]|nr:23S rRNA (guanosine(2251)-2'-O)-methyltransferase RlmB [Beijerinckiaceae bacterium]